MAASGNLPVSDNDWNHPAMEAFIEGAQELGMPRCIDYNSGDNQMGVGYFQRLIHRGYRHSAARVFLHPAGRPAEWTCGPMRAPRKSCSMATEQPGSVMRMTAIRRSEPRCSRAGR